MTRPRNRLTARSHPVAGPRRNSLRSDDAHRWVTRPTWTANSSLRRMRAKITIAVPSPTSPTIAASMLPAPDWPASATQATATIGMPSLTKLFQMPVTTTDRVARDLENPHDPSIEYVSPTAMAPPTGRALATAVVVSVTTMACG